MTFPRILRRHALQLGALGVLPGSRALAQGATFTLAFGSCNKPDQPQPLWAIANVLKPDAWLWLGDIVYADTEDIEKTRQLYAAQRRQPAYAAFAGSTRVLGTWDDHDYGANDAGADYPRRVESQAALLDFLDEPRASLRRLQAGLYASYVFGEGQQSVKVIVLDARYHREKPGPASDTLGAAQWAWLEAELSGSSSRVNVIASSYQVLPLDHHFEKWGNFPHARQRLLELLHRTRTPGVLLVSGDRHFAELSRLDAGPAGYPLYELTSSGLTHSYRAANEPNRYRVGSLYPEQNFGSLRVDFERELVVLQAIGQNGVAAIHHEIPLGRLTSSPRRSRP